MRPRLLALFALTLGALMPSVGAQAACDVQGARIEEQIAAKAELQKESNAQTVRDLRTLRDAAEAVREAGERHVTVGDLNATLDHRQLRDVLAVGLDDAVDQAGSGWQPTWPTPGEPTALDATLPLPLIAIDHVLVSDGIVATSTTTDVVPGADHLGLVARLVLPGGRPGTGA